MKKSITVLLAVISASVLFAVSYKNNTYQKLANEYTKKAQNALDAGDYENQHAQQNHDFDHVVEKELDTAG